MVVLLPQPLLPTNARVCPLLTFTVSPCKTWTSGLVGYTKLMFLNSMLPSKLLWKKKNRVHMIVLAFSSFNKNNQVLNESWVWDGVFEITFGALCYYILDCIQYCYSWYYLQMQIARSFGFFCISLLYLFFISIFKGLSLFHRNNINIFHLWCT